jgi:aspartate aminotransferase
MLLSRRATAVSESATLLVAEKAKKLKAAGVDVVDLSVGEPDFETVPAAQAAGISAIENGFTRYTPASGIPELKKAIADKLRKENGLEYEPADILVSCGAKHSIYNILHVACNPGDEVLIPAPYWVSYPAQVLHVGAKPVFVPTSEKDGFVLRAADVAKHLTRKSKVLIVNSPNNPTGAVYPEAELRKIAALAVKSGLLVISDEIYEKLVYGGARHVSLASFGKKAKDSTVVINGVSKSHAMTGWRIGYAAGPRQVISAAAGYQSHVTSNPCSISQKAAVAALTQAGNWTAKMAREFDRRRLYVLARLSKMPLVANAMPAGAFYVLVNISRLVGHGRGEGAIRDDASFATVLLERGHVAAVPGGPFGAPNFVRFSYATSLSRITEGLDRFENLVREIAR